MSRSTFQQLSFIAKLAVLWLALLVLPFTERTLLGAKSYYFLYIGLGLVFVMYGLTIRSKSWIPSRVCLRFMSIAVALYLNRRLWSFTALNSERQLRTRPQLQRQRHDLLLFATVGSQFALTAITNKSLVAFQFSTTLSPSWTSCWVFREER